jgi:molybdate transport system substrate-binding protein
VRNLAACLLAVLLPTTLRADEVLRVLAIPSLHEPLAEVAQVLERTRPGHRVRVEAVPGPELRARSERPHAADVVASDLVQDGLPVFARSAMAVVVPARRPIVTELAHLGRPNTRVAMAATAVPAGRTTARLLQRMDESGRFGAQFKLRVLVNVVSEEMEARAVLARVADGDADAGLVYAADAAWAGRDVQVLAIPPELDVPAGFAIVVPPTATRPGLAHDFVELVQGPEGQAILQRHGFGRP